MSALRLSRLSLVVGVALFFTLVAWGNIADYGSNFAFVQHVLSMDTTFQSPALMGRAITAPALHHAAYWLIIGWQILTAALCWGGAGRLWRARTASVGAYDAAKGVALLGLTAGFLLYAVGFVAVGGEWFAMWQSQTWNGQRSAHLFLTIIGAALLLLALPETEAR
jgi:predicted small integral membrane protein